MDGCCNGIEISALTLVSEKNKYKHRSIKIIRKTEKVIVINGFSVFISRIWNLSLLLLLFLSNRIKNKFSCIDLQTQNSKNPQKNKQRFLNEEAEQNKERERERETEKHFGFNFTKVSIPAANPLWQTNSLRFLYQFIRVFSLSFMIKVALLCLCPYSLCLFRCPQPHLESNATITLCYIYDNDPILKSIYRISSTWSQDTGLLLAPCLRVLLSCLECFFVPVWYVLFKRNKCLFNRISIFLKFL